MDSSATRHPDLWFDDGSVVLEVETTLFRVHRSALSSHSTVFADMFSIPQPPDQETIEGCPVVKLPDSASGVACLLEAIYNPFYFPEYFSRKDLTVSQITDNALAVLRLSTKYCLPPFRAKSISQLKKYFPSTLQAFDVTDAQFDTVPFLGVSQIISTIRVARETSALDILPCALYWLAFQSIEVIFRSMEHASLLNEVLGAWLQGREALEDAFREHTFPFVEGGAAPGCRNRLKCSAILTKMFCALICPREIRRWVTLARFKGIFLGTNLCNICIAHTSSVRAAGRQKVWDLLPQMFGLGSWENLHDI